MCANELLQSSELRKKLRVIIRRFVEVGKKVDLRRSDLEVKKGEWIADEVDRDGRKLNHVSESKYLGYNPGDETLTLTR